MYHMKSSSCMHTNTLTRNNSKDRMDACMQCDSALRNDVKTTASVGV